MRKLLPFLCFALLVSCVHREVKVPEETKKEVVQVSMKAIKRFVKAIRSNLKQAIKERGLAGAVDFCSLKAEDIIGEVNAELAPIEVVKLSDKYRNPAHKPNWLDAKVINYFKKKLAEGNLPPYYVTAIEKENEVYYVFYKPIRIEKKCLNCHGDPKKMKKEVLEVLRKRYPEDKAVGYKEGDLRGVIRVMIPEGWLRFERMGKGSVHIF